MAGDADVTISMTWAQWKFVDGTLDNTGSMAAVDLDTEVADRTVAIRRIGWAATDHIDKSSLDRGEWPPPEALHSETITVAMSQDDWRFVLGELDRWSRDQESDTEMSDAIVGLIDGTLPSA